MSNSNNQENSEVLEQILNLIRHLFEDVGDGISGNHRPYAFNREAQIGMNQAVKGMGDEMQACLKEQDYASYYVMARQQKLLVAAHEVAMSKDWKRGDKDMMQQEIMEAYKKGLDDLHENDPNAKIAINDYNGISSDEEKTALYESASHRSRSVYGKHLRDSSAKMVDRMIAQDINRLAKEQASLPLSPQEKYEGIDKDMDIGRDISDRDLGTNLDNNVSNEISGPGR